MHISLGEFKNLYISDNNKMVSSLKDLVTELEKSKQEIVEGLLINYQGKKVKIRDVASVQVDSQQNLTIQVSDSKLVTLISSAVINSDLGYEQAKNEQIKDTKKDKKNEFHFVLGQMTESTRKQSISKIDAIIEKWKGKLRKIRQDMLNLSRRELSKNDQKLAKKEIEEIDKKCLGKIMELKQKKTKSLKMH